MSYGHFQQRLLIDTLHAQAGLTASVARTLLNTRTLFPDNTAVRLHEMTGGAVAELAVLAESSLVLAASHRLDEVTPAIVEAIDQQTARAA